MVDEDLPSESEIKKMVEKIKAEAARKIGVRREIVLPAENMITVVDLKKELAEKDKKLAEKDEKLAEKDKIIEELREELKKSKSKSKSS